jgi:hypothetical protein
VIKHIFTLAVIAFFAGTLVAGCEKTSEQQVDNAKRKVGEAWSFPCTRVGQQTPGGASGYSGIWPQSELEFFRKTLSG